MPKYNGQIDFRASLRFSGYETEESDNDRVVEEFFEGLKRIVEKWVVLKQIHPFSDLTVVPVGAATVAADSPPSPAPTEIVVQSDIIFSGLEAEAREYEVEVTFSFTGETTGSIVVEAIDFDSAVEEAQKKLENIYRAEEILDVADLTPAEVLSRIDMDWEFGEVEER